MTAGPASGSTETESFRRRFEDEGEMDGETMSSSDVRRRRLPAAVVALLLLASGAQGQERTLKVVASLPTYAAIAREITGEFAEVEAIARGDEDPHFVKPRPSFARMIQEADLFITTGLDLELWVPSLLDRANNPRVIEGGAGHVVAYAGVRLLDIPATASRAQGDIHVFGNPHIHTDPINGILIARNILAGLRRVDPGRADRYEANERRFEERILRRLFGDRLVDLLGPDVLFGLARSHQFWSFARAQTYQGRPLEEYLGGWLREAEPFRDGRMTCYHKNWAYFSARFRVECAIYIEPKVGIPPSPGHVARVISFMRENSIPVLFAANYFSRSQIERVAQRTGATAVIVPEHVGGAEGADDYFALIDGWISRLASAFRAHAAAGAGRGQRQQATREPRGPTTSEVPERRASGSRAARR